MKRRKNITVCIRLAGLVRPLTGYMLLAILMGLLGHLCAAFITIFGGFALLELMGFPILFSGKTIFICIMIFAAARGLLRYAEQSCNHFIAFKLLALIRDKVFTALRRLCPAKLEGKDKGNLISVITSDIELLEVFYAHTISPAAIALLMSIVMSVFIGRFHWLLGLTAAVSYLFIGMVIPMAISHISGESGMRFREKSGALSGYVLDSLRGLSETIQYGGGAKRLAQMNCRTDELASEEERMKKMTGRNTALTNTVILTADAVMLFLSAFLYGQGLVGFDGVLVPVLALMSSFGPVVAMANLGSTLQNTFAAGNRVLDILEETPTVEEAYGNREISFSGAQTEHVSFAYGEEAILSDFSVDIPVNTVVGLVGKSGSGKSTLLKLLMRFWDTSQGDIRISGKNIAAVNTGNLREMESFVTQETHLFHDSIANNLRIARLDASQEDIETACRRASLHDFIMTLPMGYDTPVGELGDTLSGGERQRIGLARAFLHNAPFLLLDEPTSNLDSLNEAVILKSLHEQRKDKTVVLVSHRQSTMHIADVVYSVENGRMS